MRKIIPTLLASALLGAAALASAADPAADAGAARAAKRAEFQQRLFDKIDTNHDGVISRAEYQTWVDSRFARLDTDGDGSVDAQEIAASPAVAHRVQKRAEGFVKRYDTSGTGKVSKADFEAKEMARFDHLSSGADTLTEQQLAAHHGGSGGPSPNGG
ncbi:hypothetical protein [Dokdonella soli]|uniref:EF-hand domain-containing protein n=1 Tax=Dokdonella soli TaxID=529810 RepID=A0ABP3TN94_9GAMM